MDVFRIVAIYVVFACLWILFSDGLLFGFYGDWGQLTSASIFKGLLFVGVSALLLAILLKRMVAGLAERETALRSIAEHAGDAIVVFDAEMRVVYANPAASTMTGYRPDELRGMAAGELLAKSARSLLPAHIGRLGGQPFSRDQWPLLRKDGGLRIVEVTTQRLPDGRYLAISRDLSERLEAQQQIVNERHRLKTLVDAIPDPLWLKDADSVYVAVNPASETYFGRRKEEIIGSKDHDLYLPHVAAGFVASDREVMNSRLPTVFEQFFRHHDGSLRRLETTKTPVLDTVGRVIGVLGIARDMTAAFEAQEALKESEKRFRTLFECASDAVFVMARGGRFLNVNQRACDSLGYSRQDLLAMSLSDVETDHDLESLRRLWRTEFDGSSMTVYGHHRRRDGSRFPVEVRVSSYQVDDQHYFLALARDITEREQAVEALRASEEFSRVVLDSSSSHVAVLDQDGNIVAVNESWRRFAGERANTPGELAGTGIGTNFLEVCRSSTGKFSEQAAAAHAGVLEVLQGRTDHFRLDCPCQSGEGLLWFLMNVTPLRSGAGGAVVAYLDITEIRLAQEMREHAADQLKALANKHLAIQEEERRMLSLELHDHIGQVLTSLKLTLNLAQRKAAAFPSVQSLVVPAIEVVDGLVDTLRDISRRLRPPMLDDLGLASALRWHMSKLATPAGVRISLHENLGAERLAPALELACFRVMQEAVSNAIRHASASEISVTLSRRSHSLHLSIRDDGVGFDAEESFRNSQHLASLGLIGMRERVAGQDGKFRLESAPGAGTEIFASFGLHS